MGGAFAKMKNEAMKNRGGIPKIILVDDEAWFLDMAEIMIRKYCNEVSLLKFRNRDEAFPRAALLPSGIKNRFPWRFISRVIAGARAILAAAF